MNQLHVNMCVVSFTDDFLNVQSSSSHAITGLAVGLALCIMFIVAVSVFVVWKWKQDMPSKLKMNCSDSHSV